jgi:hypothetical protein
MLVAMAPGCIPGCECTTDRTFGTARITSVEPASPDMADCTNDPVEVMLEFTSEDGDVIRNVSLVVGEIYTPPRAWVESEGLTVGSVHPAYLDEITGGSCQGTGVTLQGVNDYAAGTSCFSTNETVDGGGGGAGGAGGGAGGSELCKMMCAEAITENMPVCPDAPAASIKAYNDLNDCVCSPDPMAGKCTDECANETCAGLPVVINSPCMKCVTTIDTETGCGNQLNACSNDF